MTVLAKVPCCAGLHRPQCEPKSTACLNSRSTQVLQLALLRKAITMSRVSQLPVRIGLCLSGGGFRAAAFHLGTLKYLHHVNLLNRVQLLSTVSGGTFTGARYVVSLIEQTEPEQFFKEFDAELKDSTIFPNALKLLGDGKPLDNTSGRKNIITCAAQSYCETFFKRKSDQKPILFGEILTGNTEPLTDITFNSTDFRHGLAFRFQKATKGIIGNLKNEIDIEHAKQIRLGDIVAASSCFPGGFEPLEFPGDFIWPDGVVPKCVQCMAPTPLMDGGVYDNQGLESLMYSIDRTRRDGAREIDLIVLSDTDRRADSLYSLPISVDEMLRRPDPRPNFLWKMMALWNPTLGVLAWVSWGMMALCGFSALAVLINLWLQIVSKDRPNLMWMLLTNLVPLLLAATAAVLLGIFRSTFRNKLLSRIPQLQSKGWDDLQHVPLTSALNMVILRVSSLLSLTSSVFMKRIRASGYRSVYNDSQYTGKLAANFIYSIRRDVPWDFAAPENDKKMVTPPSAGLCEELAVVPPPSSCMYCVAEDAAKVPTLLWFEKDEQRKLVAAGQMSTCLSLMKWVARSQAYDDQSKQFTDPGVQRLWLQLKADWTAFQTAPCTS